VRAQLFVQCYPHGPYFSSNPCMTWPSLLTPLTVWAWISVREMCASRGL
jgi:hypothetical protein